MPSTRSPNGRGPFQTAWWTTSCRRTVKLKAVQPATSAAGIQIQGCGETHETVEAAARIRNWRAATAKCRAALLRCSSLRTSFGTASVKRWRREREAFVQWCSPGGGNSSAREGVGAGVGWALIVVLPAGLCYFDRDHKQRRAHPDSGGNAREVVMRKLSRAAFGSVLAASTFLLAASARASTLSDFQARFTLTSLCLGQSELVLRGQPVSSGETPTPEAVDSWIALVSENVGDLAQTASRGGVTNEQKKTMAGGLNAVAAILRDHAALAHNRGFEAAASTLAALEATCRSAIGRL